MSGSGGSGGGSSGGGGGGDGSGAGGLTCHTPRLCVVSPAYTLHLGVTSSGRTLSTRGSRCLLAISALKHADGYTWFWLRSGASDEGKGGDGARDWRRWLLLAAAAALGAAVAVAAWRHGSLPALWQSSGAPSSVSALSQ